MTAILLSFIVGPLILKRLDNAANYQVVREGTPDSHAAKSKTPTMGGLIFLFSSLVATVLWGVVSVAFGAYLHNFAQYNEVYGSLGAAVALLMWFYLSAYVVLMGGCLNAAIEAGGAQQLQRDLKVQQQAQVAPAPAG